MHVIKGGLTRCGYKGWFMYACELTRCGYKGWFMYACELDVVIKGGLCMHVN